MAAYQIPAPEPMCTTGEVCQNWIEFRDAWNHYCVATGLEAKQTNPDDSPNDIAIKQTAATLCAVMGRDCLRVMNTLPTLSNDDKKDPARILAELSAHFVPQKNLLFERYKFNTAVQECSEGCDAYLVRLRQLAQSCEFGALTDSLIRDKLVISTTDSNTRQRLLREHPTPDLRRVAEALQAAQISEVHRRQMDSTEQAVDAVNRAGRNQWKRKEGDSRPCGWCGNKTRHSRRVCPAKDVTCHNCGIRGHYQSECRRKTASEVTEDETTNRVETLSPLGNGTTNRGPSSFLGDVHVEDVYAHDWVATIKVNGTYDVEFKLDTGAAVTVVGADEPALRHVELQQTDTKLLGAGDNPISTTGMLSMTLSHKDLTVEEKVYVVPGQKKPLLSRNACAQLQLLKLTVDEAIPGQCQFREAYPTLFEGLGKLEATHTISLKEGVNPTCLYAPRNVPHPILPKVEAELQDMVHRGVISPVHQPTEWCSGMVVVPKSDGRVRICVDLTNLNKAVLREVHPMKSVDESLASLSSSRVYTKLDANSGFWQIPLDESSKLLTTFITPMGRFCFNRLPFGISSAPEIFQRMMSQLLDGLDGCICHMDDVLIHGRSPAEHDERVRRVLDRIKAAGLTLNEKCEFGKTQLKFLGHIISEDGVSVDPAKIKAIREFPQPTNLTELQRFNGMVNQLNKFLPGLANHNEPLRQLLKKDNAWHWGSAQSTAFNAIKEQLLSTETLQHYSPVRPTYIAADASDAGLGAVLMQEDESGSRRPVAYASRSLSETEKRYAVIEKEALAAVWACEKFSDYVLGLQFVLETDHKPLVPLLSSKDLSKMPVRILRFRLRLMRYSPAVIHVAGKKQATADALSRAPVDQATASDIVLIDEVDMMAAQCIDSIPATSRRLQELRDAQLADEEIAAVKQYVCVGWPGYMPNQPTLRPYWDAKGHLTIADDLLLYDDRIVVPRSMRLEILERLHEGHLGITKCTARARESVWWPWINQSVQDRVMKCRTCQLTKPAPKETLMPSSFPSRPWERVGTDLFTHQGRTYVLVVDYFSRWVEMRALDGNTTSAEVVARMKSIFATHGIPETVMSDNGPQYSGTPFREFATEYGFTHVTSSPRFPQANGEAERAVQTVKNMLRRCKDPYMGLLAYRTAPLHNGFSPAELLMGRQLNTRLPVLPSQLAPQKKDQSPLQAKEEVYRHKMKDHYDKSHRAKDLAPLRPDQEVWIRDLERSGRVVRPDANPRSYVIQSGSQTIRRNRSSIIPTSQDGPTQVSSPTRSPEIAATPSTPSSPREQPMIGPGQTPVTTAYGRVVRRPIKLDL